MIILYILDNLEKALYNKNYLAMKEDFNAKKNKRIKLFCELIFLHSTAGLCNKKLSITKSSQLRKAHNNEKLTIKKSSQ